jgi:hypothetical protein
MTPFRETEMLQAKRVGLQGLLAETTDDPLEKPALEHAIRKIDARLRELADKPKINPEAEMFFVDGQVTNHH